MMKNKIYVVGMGPGKEEMMTGEALSVLEQADVIIGYTVYLQLLGARFQEKEMISTPMRQETERCRLAFEEAKKAIEGEGRPQSMELDDDTLDGKWSTNVNTGVDFFIINDAIFTKLCILGEDVEPCFEGASITAPNVSTHFTKMDDSFTQTLFTMMQDLKKIVSEGG